MQIVVYEFACAGIDESFGVSVKNDYFFHGLHTPAISDIVDKSILHLRIGRNAIELNCSYCDEGRSFFCPWQRISACLCCLGQ